MSSSGERKLLPLFTPGLNLEAESFVTERSNEIVIRDPEEALNVHVIINFKREMVVNQNAKYQMRKLWISKYQMRNLWISKYQMRKLFCHLIHYRGNSLTWRNFESVNGNNEGRVRHASGVHLSRRFAASSAITLGEAGRDPNRAESGGRPAETVCTACILSSHRAARNVHPREVARVFGTFFP